VRTSDVITLRPNFNYTIWQHESNAEFKFLEESLTFLSPHRHKSKEFQSGDWDGYWRLMWGDCFLTGLLPHIIKRALRRKIPVAVALDGGTLDERGLRKLADGDLSVCWQHRIEGDLDLGPWKLHDYQDAAVQKAVRAMRGIIEVATGGGKTLIAAGIIKTIGLPALYLVGSTKIAAQANETFLKAGFSVGQIGGGKRKATGDIVIATVQSLTKMIKKGTAEALLDRPIIIWDEVHHLSSNTWTMTGRLSRAQYRFGMSGTPFRGDGFEFFEDIVLRGVAGERIVYIPSYFLRKRGYLADPYVAMVSIRSCPNTRQFVWSNDWHKIYQYGIVENSARNKAALEIAQQLHKQGSHKVLIIVQRIEHGDALMSELHQRGVTVEFLKGGDAIRSMNSGGITERFEEWDRTRAYLESEESWVRIASPVLDEGIDLPAITAIITLAGGKSPIKTIQRIGRGLRRKEGENVVLVFDFTDPFHRVLKHHSNIRRKWYNRHRFNVSDGVASISRLLKKPLKIDAK